jgi:hypothetical protein
MNFKSSVYTPAPETFAGVDTGPKKPTHSRGKLPAISTVDSTEESILPKKIRVMPVKYHQFYDAAEYIPDEYWKCEILKASRGIFTKPVEFDGEYLVNKVDNARELLPDKPRDIARRFKSFCSKHAKMFSSTDLTQTTALRTALASQIILLDWDLCHRRMKQLRLTDYAARVTESKEEASDLTAVLRTADALKMLTKNTVSMSNNIITNVSCVDRSEVTGLWYIK